MRYGIFEKFAIVLGGGAVLSALFLEASPPLTEVLAQLLLFGVVIGAVHWGRKGGMVAALGASLVYILLQAPVLIAQQGMTVNLLVPVLVRVLTYGVVGIGGGELCARIKYVFAGMEGNSSIDEWTRVYNQRQISRLIDTAHGLHARYGAPYSVIVVTLAPGLTADLRPSKQRTMLRAVADHIRGNIRLVDDVGRLDDGRFIVLLPQTPRAGGTIAGERVRTGVRDLIGAKDESVSAGVLSAPEDSAELDALRADIRLPDVEPDVADQSASGA